MNCHKVQSLLSAYLDQELTTEERRIIRQHLFTCRTCSLEYESLSLLKSSLGSLEPPAEPDNLLARVLLVHNGPISVATLPRLALNPWTFGKKFLMTAACAALFLSASVWLFPTPQSNMVVTNSAPYRTEEDILMVNQVYTINHEEDTAYQDTSYDDKEKEEETSDPHYPLLMGIPVSR